MHLARLLAIASLAALAVQPAPAATHDLPTASPESEGLSAERLARLSAGMKEIVDSGRLAGAVGRQNVDKDYIVIDGEGGNGSTVGPDQVVLAPTFTVALESEIGVISDDVAIDEFHTFLHERIGERFKRLNGIVVALRFEIVWKFAS